jgi:hypothetical protein
MTHTNHRLVKNSESTKDYVVLAMPAKGINDSRKEEKLKEIFKIMLKYEPVNGGGPKSGTLLKDTPEQIIDTISSRTPMIHAVFNDEKKLLGCLSEIKEKDLGVSIVVSGNVQSVTDLAKQIALTPHSISYSMGISGNRQLLPPKDIMEITTMCGHGLISSKLVEKVLSELRSEKITLKEAGNILGRNCSCGVFNTERAEEILAQLLKKNGKGYR